MSEAQTEAHMYTHIHTQIDGQKQADVHGIYKYGRLRLTDCFVRFFFYKLNQLRGDLNVEND